MIVKQSQTEKDVYNDGSVNDMEFAAALPVLDYWHHYLGQWERKTGH